MTLLYISEEGERKGLYIQEDTAERQSSLSQRKFQEKQDPNKNKSNQNHF